MTKENTQAQTSLWLYAAWLTSLAATLGAVFIGEVLGQRPCVLCWYQRIAMFPREAILARLVRDMRSEMLDDFKSAIDNQRDTTLRSAVGALVSAALQHHLKNPYLTRCLEKAEDELPLDEETQVLKEAMSELIVSVLQLHGVPNPEKTAFDLVALSHGITHAATQSGQTDFEDLRMRVMRAVMGYLGYTA